MALVVPNGAEVILAAAALGKTNQTALTLRLYTVISPALSKDTVVADLTEAVGGGYAAIALTANNWTITGGSPTSAAQPAQVFTFTGTLTTNPAVLGYFSTNASGALAGPVEALAASFTPANNGDTVSVTPTITFASTTSD